jgi:salicylate hydroxylase
VVLYLHGGGYMLGSAQTGVELAARLAGAVGGTALAVAYRLAPEHAFPAALDDAVAAYRALLADDDVAAGRVVVAGDSAGGGLAVATALRARDEGLPQPRAIYAMSPFADLSLGSPSIDAREGADPAVSRDLLTDMSGSYLQGHDPRDPLASPVHGDLSGIAPLLVHAAAGEALADDARRLADAARAAGVTCELELFDDAVHAFGLFADAPDTDAALHAFGRFVAAQR